MNITKSISFVTFAVCLAGCAFSPKADSASLEIQRASFIYLFKHNSSGATVDDGLVYFLTIVDPVTKNRSDPDAKVFDRLRELGFRVAPCSAASDSDSDPDGIVYDRKTKQIGMLCDISISQTQNPDEAEIMASFFSSRLSGGGYQYTLKRGADGLWVVVFAKKLWMF